jgi:hypothetical protein
MTIDAAAEHPGGTMEAFTHAVLAKLPLAEAAQRVLAFLLEPAALNALFEEHRGGNYTKLITFATLTQLVSDALFRAKSGRAAFEQARQDERLPASLEATYGKLGRLPVAVSMALVRTCCQRAQQLLPTPDGERTLPVALQDYGGIVLDGKVSKGVQKRLKALRGAKGGLIGGRSLVAYSFTQGLVLDFHGDEDGDANDVQYVPEVVERVRPLTSGRRLWIADAQFSFVPYLTELSSAGDAYIVRLSGAAHFSPDPAQPAVTGTDRAGRRYVQDWGTLSGKRGKVQHAVRRITVERPGQKPLVIITNLQDATQYAAEELLELYRLRPDIEVVFQRITTVFALRQLIGSTPKATLFQLAICFVLYNVLQLVRAYVAAHNHKALDEVSPQKLLEDVRDELAAGYKLVGVDGLAAELGRPLSGEALRDWLRQRLALWSPRWVKGKRRRQRPPKPARRSGHACAYRIIHEVEAHCRT